MYICIYTNIHVYVLLWVYICIRPQEAASTFVTTPTPTHAHTLTFPHKCPFQKKDPQYWNAHTHTHTHTHTYILTQEDAKIDTSSTVFHTHTHTHALTLTHTNPRRKLPRLIAALLSLIHTQSHTRAHILTLEAAKIDRKSHLLSPSHPHTHACTHPRRRVLR